MQKLGSCLVGMPRTLTGAAPAKSLCSVAVSRSRRDLFTSARGPLDDNFSRVRNNHEGKNGAPRDLMRGVRDHEEGFHATSGTGLKPRKGNYDPPLWNRQHLRMFAQLHIGRVIPQRLLMDPRIPKAISLTSDPDVALKFSRTDRETLDVDRDGGVIHVVDTKGMADRIVDARELPERAVFPADAEHTVFGDIPAERIMGTYVPATPDSPPESVHPQYGQWVPNRAYRDPDAKGLEGTQAVKPGPKETGST